MKAVIHNYHTELFPSDEEVKSLCKIGQGADTCILLTISGKGWECHHQDRGPLISTIERARRNETNAIREGCEFLDNASRSDIEAMQEANA